MVAATMLLWIARRVSSEISAGRHQTFTTGMWASPCWMDYPQNIFATMTKNVKFGTIYLL
ncbi:MAG TPA: hypothetical protein DEV73_04605 [Candidatus Zambryskibacteria bacterium]|nr:hypothetical protein [Candidatus Zambryskibacteria bacterium]HBO17365.1 hypothetical protein [Candidatus Zambryskibacteria bacterium]HCH59860.1 hypothetical protein [Candidatus Zambryskibacteria bacterium]